MSHATTAIIERNATRIHAKWQVVPGFVATVGDMKPMAKLMLTASTFKGLAAIQSSAVITCDIQATLPVPSDKRIAMMFAPGATPRGATPPLPAMTPATPVS